MRSYQSETSSTRDEATDLLDVESRLRLGGGEYVGRGGVVEGCGCSSWVKWLGGAACFAALFAGASSMARLPADVTRGTGDPSRQQQGNNLALDLEGMAKANEVHSHSTVCEDGGYSKRTLQFAFELPFAGLFKDNKGQSRYEASSIILKDDAFYAVCDNSWAVSKFKTSLQPFSSQNVQIGTPSPEGAEDSGFEAIFWDGDFFYVVRESVQHADTHFHAIIEQVALGEDDYRVVESCSSNFKFEGTSKGFEGAVSVRDTNNEMVVLGLCEGNHCSETHKFDRGNGRIVAMKRVVEDDGSCTWATVRTINVPKSAFFHDYSDIAIDSKGRVAITTQEDSRVWIGQMLGQDPATGLYDIDAMELDAETYSVYDFPKNNQCETVYCNIEGVEWLNDEMIVVVSDKMKGKGKQDFLCFDKDQSVHVFVLPD